MARLLNKDPASYNVERDRFLADLKRFHENKGTPYRNLPVIDGQEIDLYQLYWIVTAHGGWEKVNSRSGWEELVSLFNISESTANGALAVKQIYLRYLDSYEKIHFLGEEEDGEDNWYNDEEDSRSRRQKAQKITSTVPLVYNQNQHNVGDEHRAALHLSTNIYRKTDYDRLTLSLISPLPNEQDFAINVCTLLSNEGRHTLKLAKCPRLLDLLLSHAGVYNHDNLKTYVNELYASSRNYDLLGFWNNVCKDRSVRDLMLNYSVKKKRWSTSQDILSLKSAKERLHCAMTRVEEELASASDDLFATGTKVGTQELSGQRILQIATIVRNLSFEDDNAQILAQNVTLLRTQWSNLNQMGFDILGNVASEVILEEQSEFCVTDVMLSTLTACIASSDRFQVISSLDILNKLCLQEANEEFIGNVLVDQQSVYDQLVTYLSLHDIHLLISTLECLYSLSCLGETSCNTIVRTHGALDALVSLITVEAQSYGPKACILMRVVETVPGTSATAGVTSATSSVSHQVQQQSSAAGASTASHNHGVSVAQLQALAPIRPQGAQQTQQQQITVVTTPIVQQQQIVRGQLIQVQRPAINILPLPRHPLPIIRPIQQNPGAAPRQIVTIQRPQQFQQHLLQQPQVSVAQIPQSPQAATAQIVSRPQAPLQQTFRLSLQQQPLQQQQPLPQLQPQQQQQQQPQQQHPQQSGSQQVQLRVCNDEANRTFCLSWLRATYEAATGCSIQHEIMYKQYLASLHKLGKRDVISAQHYAACVRSLFGGSVGPNKRQLSEGKVDQFFEGVKVRSQPLPLRIPVSANPNTATNLLPIASSPQAVAQHQTSQAVLVNHGTAPVRYSTPPAPCSPILTNLLHRRSPAPDGKNIDPQLVQRQTVAKQSMPLAIPPQASGNQIGSADQEENGTSVLDGILPKDPQFGRIEEDVKVNDTNCNVAGNGMLAHILEKKPQESHHMVNGISSKEIKITDKGLELIPNHHVKKMNGGGSGDLISNNLKRAAVTELDDGVTPAKNVLIDSSAIAIVANGLEGDSNDPILKKDVNLAQASTTVSTLSQVYRKISPPCPILGNQQQQLVNAMPQQQQRFLTTVDGHQVLQTSSGHQIIAKGGGPTATVSNAQQTSVQVAGHTMIMPAGSQPDQGPTPKTIIILQPQTKITPHQHPPQQQSQATVTIANGPPATVQQLQQPMLINNMMVNGQVRVNGARDVPQHQEHSPLGASQPLPPSAPNLTSPSSIGLPSSSSLSPSGSQPLGTASAASTSGPSPTVPTVPFSSATATPIPKPNPQTPFLCEWQSCMKAFKTPKEVENHAIKVHCPLGDDDIPCLWLRCDGMKRKRFSLMTHIQDRHCHPQMATTGKSEVPLPPAPPPHPGYAPNAAYHAIKRHAAEFVNPKALAMGDEKEGPVTKSIRLTSALILKNLVIYSSLGKKRLKSYESHLSTVALSNVEASRTVSQILFEMADCDSTS